MSERRWTVQRTRGTDKDIARQRAHTTKILTALTILEIQPLKGHALTGKLQGARSLGFSVPGTQFRALYVIYAELRLCLVFMVGPHENIYRDAETRYANLAAADRTAPE